MLLTQRDVNSPRILRPSGCQIILMKAIEKTLADLPITNADALYERAYALRMGDGVRINLRAAHRLFMLAAL